MLGCRSLTLPMDWLVYALGGGLGHLQRELALARRAVANGHRVRILSNSPWAVQVRDGLADLNLQGIEIVPLVGPEEVIAQAVKCELQGSFEALIVDTLPRGIAGELEHLVELDCPKILVQRAVTPTYAARPDVVTAMQQYDLVLKPGEGPADKTTATEPWLLFDKEELMARDEARQALGADDRSVVVVIGCGAPSEARLAAGLGDRLRVALGREAQVITAMPSTHWPLLRMLPGVDVLIGSGGYNTVYEARATHTPLIAFARERLYDEQDERLVTGERVSDWTELVGLCETHLESAESRAAIDYVNGTRSAVAAIEAAATA